jgi:hypothetical protein
LNWWLLNYRLLRNHWLATWQRLLQRLTSNDWLRSDKIMLISHGGLLSDASLHLLKRGINLVRPTPKHGWLILRGEADRGNGH